jgi:predicted ribosome quality control (RQC) complex YloA/Tae2 family protein
METKDKRIYSLVVLLDWQTKFFTSAVEGISAQDAQKRLNTKANHIAWLAGSIVQQRYELAQYLLKDNSLKQEADSYFNNNQGIKEGVTYPSIEQYEQDWKTITPKLHEALLNADAQTLDTVIDMGGMQMTFLEWLTFSVYREASQIGQIALWRRLLGYEAMKYM